MFKPAFKSFQRTRNRLREHKTLVIEIDGDNYIPGLPTKGKFSFKCEDPGCQWVGWIPKNEILFDK